MVRSVLLVLGLCACVPRDARRGDEFALAGNWEGASEHYRRASVQRPQSARIAAKGDLADRMLQKERIADAEAARQRAETALAAGNYDTAFSELLSAKAMDPSSEAIALLASVAGEQVRSLAEERARAEGWSTAYPFSVLSLRLDPAEPQSVALVTRARTGVLAEVDGLLEASDFAGARELTAMIAAAEPSLQQEVDGRVTSAWSADLVRTAEALAKKGRKGEAWMQYARAAAMDPSAAAVSGREELGRSIIESQRATVSWPAPDKALASDLVGLSRGALVDDGLRFDDGGAIQLSSVGATWSCGEKVVNHAASQQYVARTRWVENPDRRAAEAKAYEARADVPEHEALVASTYSRIEQLQYASEQRRADWRVLEDAALRVEETARTTQDWLSEAERALDQAEQDLAGLSSEVDSSEWVEVRDEWAREVSAREATLSARNDEAQRARSLANELGQKVSTTESDLGSARDDYASQQTKLAEVVANIDRADAAVAALPTQVEEPVYATFPYTVYEVVRTCEVKATAKLGARGKTTPRAYAATRTVSDRHHPAHPDYGVKEDPLALPSEDAALVQASLSEVSGKLVTDIRSEREAYYQGLVSTAAGASLNEASALQGALLVLQPSVADAAWVRERWGVEAKELLGR
ncbi:MAG: hypothetical protein KC912_09570 [Proteobacteria bacterium]|nr:hypothetical protein [Pseudomonadota bacterium]